MVFYVIILCIFGPQTTNTLPEKASTLTHRVNSLTTANKTTHLGNKVAQRLQISTDTIVVWIIIPLQVLSSVLRGLDWWGVDSCLWKALCNIFLSGFTALKIYVSISHKISVSSKSLTTKYPLALIRKNFKTQFFILMIWTTVNKEKMGEN